MENKIENQLKEVVRRAIENKEVAGCSLLVNKNGQEVFFHSDGLASKDKPVKRDTIFRLYSLTKGITAAAVMLLMERGEIDLYEPVSKFLPGFKNQTVEANGKTVTVSREVTVHDLLSMTSGLAYDGKDMAGREANALFKEIESKLFTDSPLGTVEAMNRLGTFPLAFQPGTSWRYGSSADVLGAIIEIVSGKRFGEFLKDEIFKPLGMEDTGFWVPGEKRERLSTVYAKNESGELVPYYGNHLGIINGMDRNPAFESGGAGLASTLDDTARFAGMLLNGGIYNGTRILREKTVKYLTSCSLNDEQQAVYRNWFGQEGYTYSNLIRTVFDESLSGGICVNGEYNCSGWLGANFDNNPRDKISFVFMIQRTDAGVINLTRKLKNIIWTSL